MLRLSNVRNTPKYPSFLPLPPCPPTHFADLNRRVWKELSWQSFFFWERAVCCGMEPHGHFFFLSSRIVKRASWWSRAAPPTPTPCNKDAPWLTGAWIHARIFTSFRFIAEKSKITGAAPPADPTAVVYSLCCKMRIFNCFVNPWKQNTKPLPIKKHNNSGNFKWANIISVPKCHRPCAGNPVFSRSKKNHESAFSLALHNIATVWRWLFELQRYKVRKWKWKKNHYFLLFHSLKVITAPEELKQIQPSMQYFSHSESLKSLKDCQDLQARCIEYSAAWTFIGGLACTSKRTGAHSFYKFW